MIEQGILANQLAAVQSCLIDRGFKSDSVMTSVTSTCLNKSINYLSDHNIIPATTLLTNLVS